MLNQITIIFKIIQFFEMFLSSNLLSTNILLLRNRIPLIIKVSCYLSMSVFISQRKKTTLNHIKIHQHDDIIQKYLVQMYDD